MDVHRFVISVLAVALVAVGAAAQRWEEAPGGQPVVMERTDGDDITITTRDGYVYLTTSRRVTVKVFSILGQLISQDAVGPGTHRLRLSTRGVFILKAGGVTRRVTI